MIRTVAQIMTTDLITLAPQMNIHEATRILVDNRISGAPVVDGEGKLVGVLSKKDCLRIAFTSHYHDDWGGPVSHYMTSPVQTLDAELDEISAAQMFLDSPFRRFPVMRGTTLVGQVSRADILKALYEDL